MDLWPAAHWKLEKTSLADSLSAPSPPLNPDSLYAHQPDSGRQGVSCLSWNTACPWRCGSDSHGSASGAGSPSAAAASSSSTTTSTCALPLVLLLLFLLAIQPCGCSTPEPAEEAELGAYPQREGGGEEERVERGNPGRGRVPNRPPFSGWAVWSEGQQASGQNQHPETQVGSAALQVPPGQLGRGQFTRTAGVSVQSCMKTARVLAPNFLLIVFCLFTDHPVGLQTQYEHWNISTPVQDVSFFILNQLINQWIKLGPQTKIIFIVDLSIDYCLDEWISCLVSKMVKNVDQCFPRAKMSSSNVLLCPVHCHRKY